MPPSPRPPAFAVAPRNSLPATAQSDPGPQNTCPSPAAPPPPAPTPSAATPDNPRPSTPGCPAPRPGASPPASYPPRGLEVNGIRLKAPPDRRIDIAQPGLWLPIMNSLNCGLKVKKSCRMNRAVIGSPPVICLMRFSAQCSAFLGLRRRHQPGALQPRQLGRCRSPRDAERIHRRRHRIILHDPGDRVSSTPLPLPPAPKPNHNACSEMSPVRQ